MHTNDYHFIGKAGCIFGNVDLSVSPSVSSITQKVMNRLQ